MTYFISVALKVFVVFFELPALLLSVKPLFIRLSDSFSLDYKVLHIFACYYFINHLLRLLLEDFNVQSR